MTWKKDKDWMHLIWQSLPLLPIAITTNSQFESKSEKLQTLIKM